MEQGQRGPKVDVDSMMTGNQNAGECFHFSFVDRHICNNFGGGFIERRLNNVFS